MLKICLVVAVDCRLPWSADWNPVSLTWSICDLEMFLELPVLEDFISIKRRGKILHLWDLGNN